MITKFPGNCGRCGRPIAAGTEVKYARFNIWHPTYLDCYIDADQPVYVDGKLTHEGTLNTPDVTPLTKDEAKLQVAIDKARAERKASKVKPGAVKSTKSTKSVAKQAEEIAEEIPQFVKDAMVAMSPEAAATFVRSWLASK